MKWMTTVFAVLFLTFTAQAKDLTHRLGIGFKNNTSQDLPSLAVVYYPTQTFGLTGGFGMDTKKDYNSTQVMLGARQIIYPEPNMNFYVAAQGAIVNYENPVDGKKSGIDVAGLFGVEFFFAGLENLGFTFEAGLSLSTANNSRFRTVGDDPFRAGMIFYF
jgi:hypothetical protein